MTRVVFLVHDSSLLHRECECHENRFSLFNLFSDSTNSQAEPVDCVDQQCDCRRVSLLLSFSSLHHVSISFLMIPGMGWEREGREREREGRASQVMRPPPPDLAAGISFPVLPSIHSFPSFPVLPSIHSFASFPSSKIFLRDSDISNHST